MPRQQCCCSYLLSSRFHSQAPRIQTSQRPAARRSSASPERPYGSRFLPLRRHPPKKQDLGTWELPHTRPPGWCALRDSRHQRRFFKVRQYRKTNWILGKRRRSEEHQERERIHYLVARHASVLEGQEIGRLRESHRVAPDDRYMETKGSSIRVNLLLRCHSPAQVLLDGGTVVIGELLRLSAPEQILVVTHRVAGWAVSSLPVWDREGQINSPPGR